MVAPPSPARRFMPPMRSGLLAFATLTGGQALAEAPPLSRAVVETFTCANLSPDNAADPEAVQLIARAVAMVHNTGTLPPGAGRARVVLRLCFNGDLDQPIVERVEYSGPLGEVADATERAARGAVMRALRAGTLTRALSTLGRGKPENAVIDLVFGAAQERG